MEELYWKLRGKLDEMRTESKPTVEMTFGDVSKLYQLVCMMKQIKDIAIWCDNGYS